MISDFRTRKPFAWSATDVRRMAKIGAKTLDWSSNTARQGGFRGAYRAK